MLRKILVGVLALGAVAAPAAAQRQFQVGPRAGYTRFAEKTGIQSSAMLGLDAMYSPFNNLSVGVRFDFARPVTDGRYSTAEMTFGDTTMLFTVSQPLTIVHYAVAAEYAIGGRLSPFLNGAVGGYRISLDPQAANAATAFNELLFAVGGGIDFAVSGNTSIRLSVTDLIYNKFDRAALNTVDPRFAPVIFPDAVAPQPPFEGAAHNLHFALAFSFAPGGQ
jgi:opacity protein-like surface antigen